MLAAMRAPGFASPKSRMGVGTTIAGAASQIDEGMRRMTRAVRRGRGVLPARRRELIAPVAHGLGPWRRLEPARDGIELAQLGGTVAIVHAGVVLREGIEGLEETREPRRGLPAIVASREPRRELGVIDARTERRIGLEEQVGAGDLAVEVLRELGGAGRERRAPLCALGLADLPQPAVLQHRQQRDQSQQRDGHDRERWPEAPPHIRESSTTLVARNAAASPIGAVFTSLTNS